MLRLFYAPSTCALASHIALQEAGADYETVRLDFGSNDQHKPEYLAINPKGRVPALATDRGILTETPPILIFVAQSFPQSHLAPLDDAFLFARVQAFNSYLCTTVSCRSRPSYARLSLGRSRRHRCYRRDAKEGAAIRSRVLRPYRARDVCRPLGDGRQLHNLRFLSLYLGSVAGRRWRRSEAISQGPRPRATHVGVPRGTNGVDRGISPCRTRLDSAGATATDGFYLWRVHLGLSVPSQHTSRPFWQPHSPPCHEHPRPIGLS